MYMLFEKGEVVVMGLLQVTARHILLVWFHIIPPSPYFNTITVLL